MGIDLFHSSVTTKCSQKCTVHGIVRASLKTSRHGQLAWEWRGEDLLSLLEMMVAQLCVERSQYQN